MPHRVIRSSARLYRMRSERPDQYGQTNSKSATNVNVPVNIQVKDIQVAGDNGTATGASKATS